MPLVSVVIFLEVSSSHFSQRTLMPRKGGISFASSTKGFGANNVVNYEIVLANGTIIQANDEEHPDLFWALKLAGSNFGVVTRFDMPTYTSPAIWGDLTVYPATAQSISDVLNDFASHVHDTTNDTKEHKVVILAQSGQMSTVVSAQANIDGTPLNLVSSVEPLIHIEKHGSTQVVVDEVMSKALTPTALTAWYTFTTKVDAGLYQDIYEAASSIFSDLFKRDERLEFTMSLMAVPKTFTEKTAQSPIYNALKRSGDDLISQY